MSDTDRSPLALRPQQHLLFIGDSITHAFRKPEEINVLYQMGNGYAGFCAGCVDAAHPGFDLAWSNRGECGHHSVDLAQRWKRDCLDLAPDVVTILIGTNDAMAAAEGEPIATAEFEACLTGLVADLAGLARAPQVVLLEPFQLPCGIVTAATVEALTGYRAAVRAVAEHAGCRFVPLQDDFTRLAGDHPERLCYDGIHPTASGHYLIATRWLRTLGITLPEPVEA